MQQEQKVKKKKNAREAVRQRQLLKPDKCCEVKAMCYFNP